MDYRPVNRSLYEKYEACKLITCIIMMVLFVISIITVCIGVYTSVIINIVKTDTKPIEIIPNEPIVKETIEYSPATEEYSVHQLAGQEYNVDPVMLEAIERFESGHYTSTVYMNNNNTHGAKCWKNCNGSSYMTFDSPEDSTFFLAKNIRENYINIGLDTLEEIQGKYCPESDGCNADRWVNSVTSLMKEIKAGYYD